MESKNITANQIEEMAVAIQNETHDLVEQIVSAQPMVSYQDATNTVFFRLIAELKLKVTQLESANGAK